MDAGWEEVERMAQAASSTDAIMAEEYPSEEQITRWRSLFNYTRLEALALIAAQRKDLTRTRISDEHWELVREGKEKMGHDRETYEHSQNLGKVLLSQSAVIPSADGQTLFLFRLGGLLDSEEKVGEIAGLQDTPRVVVGSSEMESKARFCLVDEKAKRKIEEWLARVGKGKDI